jgi:hypothetical protein
MFPHHFNVGAAVAIEAMVRARFAERRYGGQFRTSGALAGAQKRT